MRALTLTQPWAGLVASGIKRVENRPRPMIKRDDVGAQFAIHASRAIDEAVFERLKRTAPELFEDTPANRRWQELARITSAMISVATLRDVLLVGGCTPTAIAAALERYELADQARFAFGPVVYVLADPRALEAPVPCRGWQGFWTLAPGLAQLVEGQL